MTQMLPKDLLEHLEKGDRTGEFLKVKPKSETSQSWGNLATNTSLEYATFLGTQAAQQQQQQQSLLQNQLGGFTGGSFIGNQNPFSTAQPLF